MKSLCKQNMRKEEFERCEFHFRCCRCRWRHFSVSIQNITKKTHEPVNKSYLSKTQTCQQIALIQTIKTFTVQN